jgi:hypothetical protein
MLGILTAIFNHEKFIMNLEQSNPTEEILYNNKGGV